MKREPVSELVRPPDRPRSVHWPFASVALLLVLLILLTPALEQGLTPAGTVLSQGTLYVTVDQNGTFTFLLESLGHLTLSRISLGLNESARSIPGNATTPREWNRWENGTLTVGELLSVNGTTLFLLNATTVYDSSSEQAMSVGVFAFQWVPAPASSGGDRIVVTPVYPLVGPTTLPQGSAPTTYDLSRIPQPLDLLLAAYPPVSLPSGSTGGGA